MGLADDFGEFGWADFFGEGDFVHEGIVADCRDGGEMGCYNEGMKVIIDGIVVDYVATGRGKAVVFLHGWGSSKEAFDGLLSELKKKYRVVAVDFPGFGGSDEPVEAWGVEEYVDFVAKFVEKVKLKNVYAIVGHSFGGRVILKGCGTGKLSAEKLIFLDSGGVKRKRTAKMRAYGSLAKMGRAVSILPGVKTYAKLMRVKLYSAAGATDYVGASEVMRETFKNVVAEDLKPMMAKITQPSLVIWGADDKDTPVSDAYEFKKMKNSRVHILSEAGHYVFLDRPDKVLELMKEFLGK